MKESSNQKMQENKPVLELENTGKKSVSGIEMEEKYFSLHPSRHASITLKTLLTHSLLSDRCRLILKGEGIQCTWFSHRSQMNHWFSS